MVTKILLTTKISKRFTGIVANPPSWRDTAFAIGKDDQAVARMK
jgi:hypothetical protein